MKREGNKHSLTYAAASMVPLRYKFPGRFKLFYFQVTRFYKSIHIYEKTINHLLACYLLITASCSKQIDKPVVTAVEESPLAASHFIGEHFGGGIIFI